MRISIIIPVYNVAEYVVECLDSITAQTYMGDVECLLVDDCSTDDSPKIIRNYIKEYNGRICFRLICQPTNQRQGMARNRGIEESTGDYILFVDSDDVISSDCLTVMINLLSRYPEADFVLCSMKTMNGELSFSTEGYPEYTDNRKWLMYNSIFPEAKISPSPCNKLIRKKLLIDNDIKFPANVIYEDAEFSFLLGLYVNSGCFSNAFTYYYRTNRVGSTITTTSKQLDYGFVSRMTILCNLLKRVTNENKSMQLKAIFSRYVLYLKINNVNVISRNKDIITVFKQKFLTLSVGVSSIIYKFLLNLPVFFQRNNFFYKLISITIR